jgi:hypothetical protein
MAVIGKGYAIIQSGKIQLSGFLAWQAWATIHILYLAQRNLRFSVLLQWAWSYFTGGRGSRLIVNPRPIEPFESAPAHPIAIPAPPPPAAAAVGARN